MDSFLCSLFCWAHWLILISVVFFCPKISICLFSIFFLISLLKLPMFAETVLFHLLGKSSLLLMGGVEFWLLARSLWCTVGGCDGGVSLLFPRGTSLSPWSVGWALVARVS
jgi:hypothetical protein